MARPYKLRELERNVGNLHEVIPSMVNLHGQAEAARRLGVSQFTISRWLKDNGYVQKVRYEKEMEQTAQ